MNRGDVILDRFPHPSGLRGKKRPAVVVQSNSYAGAVSTLVVAEVTKNLTMKGDPACLFIDVSTPDGKATGLLLDSAGRFQQAEGGTLFLDEIGEMSPSAQAKLLRVLENRQVDPLGDTRSIHVDIRVIAATNEDLPVQIKAGRFRLDLYYRLNVYQLRIPPLRERHEDIEPILTSFLEIARRDHGCRIKGANRPGLVRRFQ